MKFELACADVLQPERSHADQVPDHGRRHPGTGTHFGRGGGPEGGLQVGICGETFDCVE